MNFHHTLQRHYNAVSARLDGAFLNKKPWHAPHVTLVWWRPQVVPVGTNVPGVPKTLQAVIFGISFEHNISWDDIVGYSRLQKVVRARQHLYYAAMRDTKITGASLSKYFQRDHTTVIHGVDAHARRHNLEYPRVRNKIRFLSKDITDESHETD